MREAEFRGWLKAQNFAENTVSTRLSDTRRVELHYGDLDSAYEHDRFTAILSSLAYSKEDEKVARPNPSSITVTGSVYNSLASYRSAIVAYRRFLTESEPLASTANLTREDILAAVARCKAAGSPEAFIASLPGLGQPRNYWLLLEGERYPSKAIVRDALRATGNDAAPGGGLCKELLERLGFVVIHWPNMREACATFLRRMPGFTTFRDRSGQYWKTEREYKERSTQAVSEIANSTVSDSEAGLAIVRRLTLGERGLPLNWQMLDSLSKAAPHLRESVFAALGALARADGDAAAALERAARVLEDARAQGVPNLQTGAVLNTVISIMGTVQPLVSAWFKVTRMKEAGARLFGRKLFSSPTFQRAEFAEFDQLLFALFEFLKREQGWEPDDLMDVQGFLWVALASDAEWSDDVPVASPDTPITSAATSEREILMPSPTNLILHGPPGTGKTYTTAAEAVRLCGESVPDDRDALMALYASLQHKGRIGFVTFHQNFAYEDFIEGLRPVTSEAPEGETGNGFSLEPQDGIFKQIAEVAASNRGKAVAQAPVIDRSRKVFKMSLGRSWASEDDAIYQDAIRDGYVTLGWGGEVDWSDPCYEKWDAIKERWREDNP